VFFLAILARLAHKRRPKKAKRLFMYLQSLEMIGFKSFALRTVLNFHRGVTAVVGPNGCGKSNVLDAIRWVLGEQSARALRGGEMADVIFSGTDSRPALGMAEVSMTFAECEKELGVEWNEVCVTRRVFRDGKSEYLLNKAPCRLRDIHQLFMDTGVGRSAYSIMEQGKIDLILSSRPEDRRTIFEEAAGITKYKAQKKEALRKLEYTEANLLRVQDIIKEVRRQIGSLQRQAAKARRYQALMKDLGIFDTHLSHKNYRELVRNRDEVRRELARNDDQRATHETEVLQQESELSTFRARLEALDAQVSDVRDDLQGLKSRIFSAETRISTNSERSEEARSLIERHRLEIAAAGEKMRVQQNEIEHTDELLARMVDTLRSDEVSLEEQNQKVRVAREERTAIERDIQELGLSAARLDTRLGSLRNELSAAGGRREAAETRLRLLQGESEAAAQAAGEFAARIKETKRRAQLAQVATGGRGSAQQHIQGSRQHRIAGRGSSATPGTRGWLRRGDSGCSARP
jgi:chromosome segregation protein